MSVDRFAEYPDIPGFRGDPGGPSHEAAEAIRMTAPHLRTLVLSCINRHSENGITADEIADELRISILSIRPRVTELGRDGLIRKTDERRINRRSGLRATVWKPRTP